MKGRAGAWFGCVLFLIAAAATVGAQWDSGAWSGGGGGDPAGSDNEFQFRDGDGFGASSAVSRDPTTGRLVASSGVGIGTDGVYISVPNEGTTGTTLSKLAKLTTSGEAELVGAGDTDSAIGVCASGCGTTGSAELLLVGEGSCVFDAGTTAGNLVGISGSVAGNCEDVGSTLPASPGAVLGRVMSTNGAGGTYSVLFQLPDIVNITNIKGGGGKPGRASGAADEIQVSEGNGKFGSDADFRFDPSTNRLHLDNLTIATGGTDQAVDISGTFQTPATNNQAGFRAHMTSAGSGAFEQRAANLALLAGYTGSARTYGIFGSNLALGTGNDWNLDDGFDPVANMAVRGLAGGSAVTAGSNVGGFFRASSADGFNAGVIGEADWNEDGSNFGVVGSAHRSMEATDWKNVGGWFSLGCDPHGGTNESVGLGVTNCSEAADIQQWFDNTTEVAAVENGGVFRFDQGFKIGFGQTMDVLRHGSGTLNFPSTNGETCDELTFTVLGASAGDPVALSVPDAATNSAESMFMAWVSAADTITVRHCCTDAGISTCDPANAIFRVAVFGFV